MWQMLGSIPRIIAKVEATGRPHGFVVAETQSGGAGFANLIFQKGEQLLEKF